jgi:hypothetical protein
MIWMDGKEKLYPVTIFDKVACADGATIDTFSQVIVPVIPIRIQEPVEFDFTEDQDGTSGVQNY